jgi:hypothetical protein
MSYWVPQFTFRGDTVINGKSLVKVYRNDYNIDTSYNVVSNTFNYVYVFAVRDSAKKVFTIKANDSIERLVYDFSLSIGDTMVHYRTYHAMSYDTSILFSVDSFLIKYPTPHYRKRFNYAGHYSYFPEVEGIPIGYLGEATLYIRTTACRVSCIQQSDDYIMKPCDTCDCFSMLDRYRKLAINENKKNNNLSVYPNPFSEIITIDFKDLQINGFIKIIDIAGREVLNRKVNHNKSIQIDLAKAPSGIYIVSVEMNQKISYAKIVKE